MSTEAKIKHEPVDRAPSAGAIRAATRLHGFRDWGAAQHYLRDEWILLAALIIDEEIAPSAGGKPAAGDR